MNPSIGIIVDGTPSRHSAWALRRFGEEPSAFEGQRQVWRALMAALLAHSCATSSMGVEIGRNQNVR